MIFQTIPNSSKCKGEKGTSIVAEQVEKNKPEMVCIQQKSFFWAVYLKNKKCTIYTFS